MPTSVDSLTRGLFSTLVFMGEFAGLFPFRLCDVPGFEELGGGRDLLMALFKV